eukprot:8972248-Lingulodinium_polyedra.AAC.1
MRDRASQTDRRDIAGRVQTESGQNSGRALSVFHCPSSTVGPPPPVLHRPSPAVSHKSLTVT